MMVEIPERIWNQVDHGRAKECWLWTGSMQHGGGHFSKDGKAYSLRRVMWQNAHPSETLTSEDVVVPSVCDEARCVNPLHLVAMPRSDKPLAGWAKDHAETDSCPQGHPYDEANTHIDPRGRRRCRQCNTDRLRAMRRRKREERA